MQTRQWTRGARATWKVLPLHLQLHWRESLSSYIIRLAEANGLKSTNDLAVLSGIQSWTSLSAAPDYSAYSAKRLAGIAGCSPDVLWNATFYHLARHFACPATFAGEAMRSFLQGSVATSLRYCPLCLAEMPYYRLCWRFLAIAGCPTHHCHLLSTCGHCGTPVPLLPRVPRLLACATCQGDLRACPTSLLPPQAGLHLDRHAHDLDLLLMPTGWAPEIRSALVQGRGLIFLRQRKQWSRTQVAHMMERDEQVIAEMEAGHWGEKATFANYWQYTALLGSSLSEVLEAAQIMRGSEQERKRSRLDELAVLVQLEDLSRSRAERLQEVSTPTRPPRRPNKSAPPTR